MTAVTQNPFEQSITPNQESQRNIGLDLYRFMCMFLITSIHLGYTYINTNTQELIAASPFDNACAYLLSVLQLFGINGFVLISAYFLSAKPFSVKRIISFLSQLLFCGIFMFVFMSIVTGTFSIKNLLHSLLPILTQHYWYPAAYLIVLLAAPFMNKLINILTKKQFLLLIGLFFCSQTLLFSTDLLYDSYIYLGHASHGIIWFIFLYFVAAYIKKYGITHKVLLGPILFLATIVITASLRILFNTTAISLPKNMQILDNNGILALLLSVSSFITFSMIKTKNKVLYKCATFCSPALFFIYLIQEHCAVRDLFWKGIERIESYIINPILLSLIAFVALLVSAIVLYQIYKLMRKLFIDRLENKICSIIERTDCWLSSKLT